MFFPVNTLILLFFLAGVVFLQIFLSKCENKWAGLIIPIISFAFSIITFLNALSIGVAITGFIIANIPTAILLAIYFVCHEKKKKNKEIDKMNIQDL